MTRDPLEDRLRDALGDIGPSEAAARRATEAAVAAVRTRRRTRRTVVALALAGAVAAAGVGTAAVVMSDPDDPAVPAGREARAAIAESAVLARAPWLAQRGGAPLVQTARPLPSLRFPAGTTYAAAVNGLARAVAARGTLPRGAVLAPPLARGVVWAPRLRRGPRLSLTVPFAYAVPEGAILPPDHRISPKATPEQAARIAEALADGRRLGDRLARLVSVTVPRLRACQRLPRAAACRLEAPER